MLRLILACLGLVPVVVLAQDEAKRFTLVEQAMEVASAQLRLPAEVPATITARACSECPAQTLRITPATRFFIGKEPVTQVVFNRHVQQFRPTLGIFYGKASEITRFVAFGRTPAVAG